MTPVPQKEVESKDKRPEANYLASENETFLLFSKILMAEIFLRGNEGLPRRVEVFIKVEKSKSIEKQWEEKSEIIPGREFASSKKLFSVN